jgi:hypothetical protein
MFSSKSCLLPSCCLSRLCVAPATQSRWKRQLQEFRKKTVRTKTAVIWIIAYKKRNRGAMDSYFTGPGFSTAYLRIYYPRPLVRPH